MQTYIVSLPLNPCSSSGSLRNAACKFGFVSQSGTTTFDSLCDFLVVSIRSIFATNCCEHPTASAVCCWVQSLLDVGAGIAHRSFRNLVYFVNDVGLVASVFNFCNSVVEVSRFPCCGSGTVSRWVARRPFHGRTLVKRKKVSQFPKFRQICHFLENYLHASRSSAR